MVGIRTRRARRIPAMIESPISTKVRYAIRDNTVVQLPQPETITADIPQMNYETAVISGAIELQSTIWHGLVQAGKID